MKVRKRSTGTRFDDLLGGLPSAVVPEDVDLERLSSESVARLGDLKAQDL